MSVRTTTLAAIIWRLVVAACILGEEVPHNESVDFVRDIQPIFASHCLKCHGPDEAEGGLQLTDAESAMQALDSGFHAIVPKRLDESELLRRVATDDAGQRMPPQGPPLEEHQIKLIADWISQGANWPTHWSLAPLKRPAVPTIDGELQNWSRTPIDAFILDGLQQRDMKPAMEADKRTLLRRVYFDLVGIPPTPEQMRAFLADDAPDAFEKVVDRLLASPRYGERWARHWMDVVHYADTHGHDEDAIREHAWPYRDYLIESFNSDKPYTQFVQEQIAGDVLFPRDPHGVVATGMLAAGPWDESSQMGIQDGTTDKEIARYLDRDDMIATVMNTFVSMTVHCARCHDHKFDPITTEDYYSLQAVFAGVDRVDRPYDRDETILDRRRSLLREKSEIDAGSVPANLLHDPEFAKRVAQWEEKVTAAGGDWQILQANTVESSGGATATKQADGSILFSGERPQTDVYTITAHVKTKSITAVRLEVLTDESLFHQGPGRQDNGNLHLSEFKLFIGKDDTKEPVELHQPVADFDQQGCTIAHALDGNPQTAWGIFPNTGQSHAAMFALKTPLDATGGVPLTFVLEQLHGGVHLIGRPRLSVTSAAVPQLNSALPDEISEIMDIALQERTEPQRSALALHVLRLENEAARAALPKQELVYSIASDFEKNGNFVPAKKPRSVHVLRRGDVLTPIKPAQPGALSCVSGLEPRFVIDDPENERVRRAALARWVSSDDNVLTWRSIVNRVWHYHFGRGIVETCNDFGRNGSPPTHPQLLDWLADWFRDPAGGDGSLKNLHRLMVTSAVYRQSSGHNPNYATVDRDNRYLWRMNRQRLDAESVRDSILQISGKMNWEMGGPSDRHFVAEKGVHVTPTVEYEAFDIDSPTARRRSVYRFIFRTVPDPLMEALDCPDASQFTPRRNTSITPVQALAMLNSRFVVRYSEHLAQRIEQQHADADSQVEQLFELAYGRPPGDDERKRVVQYAQKRGLANACRIILNSNEFMFVD